MMRLILESDDGSQIDLHEDGCVLLDGYFPETTNLEEHVTETIEVRINGDYATVQAKLRDINRMLVYASENKIGPFGVWLRFALTDTDDLWRSRVYGGMIDYDAKMAYYLKRSQLKIGLIVERDGFWEGPEGQIPLTNGNGTNNTAGLNVYNCNDGTGTSPNKKNNYVEIAAAAVGGDLPAPVRLEMRNDYNDAIRLNQIRVGHNVNSTPDLFQHFLEGESASYGGTSNASAGASNGYYQNFSWAGDSQVQIGRWSLDSTFLNRANRNYFKIVAGFLLNFAAGIRLQFKLMYTVDSPLTVISSSQEVVTTGDKMQEIGELQIPPWLLPAGSSAGLSLALYAKKTGGGSLGIDYLQLTPVDGYRLMSPVGWGISYQQKVIDDGIYDAIWKEFTSGEKVGIMKATGNPIRLIPNKLQRFYFLQASQNGDIIIDRLLNVKAFYRPRRRGL